MREIRILLIAVAAILAPSCETIPEGFAELTAEEKNHRPTGQVQHGQMSWYSVKTNGGTATASGEKFSNSGFTAAHRTLPIGSIVKVTNLSNQRSAVVRINDRGPYTAGRIIDVSIGVADHLEFVGRGVAPCRVEVLKPVRSR